MAASCLCAVQQRMSPQLAQHMHYMHYMHSHHMTCKLLQSACVAAAQSTANVQQRAACNDALACMSLMQAAVALGPHWHGRAMP